jgi:membrane-bound metal-dependent hydrolase YbcI (DUF457 family)
MDPLTHALASYSLKRAAFPRLPRPATIAMILAGALADLDSLSSRFGPSAFLTWHRTAFHSLPAAVLISLLAAIPFFFLNRRIPEKRISPLSIFIPALAASLLHLLLDLFQFQGLTLVWPFNTRRFPLDWLGQFDLWILAILLASVLLPILARLVTEEIGGKSKGSRGRLGAAIGLTAVLLYVGARAVLHSNAVATLESRSYSGESSRHVAAFPISSSLFRWQGIVETDHAIHELEVNTASGAEFDPDRAVTSYKPEPSPALDAARTTPVAQRFLQAARFPRATVEQTSTGFRVTLRAFPYTRKANSGPQVEAVINTDPTGKVLSQDLVWAPRLTDSWPK